jgi:ThiF family
MRPTCEVVFTGEQYAELYQHLFPGDADEHGAVALAGVAQTSGRIRLLVREVIAARDGKDFVPGQRGYRMLTADFVADQILRARAEKLAYLAIHNHGPGRNVGFSPDDIASHERGYPALLDIADGMPVGGLVFASEAVAGDIWLPGRRRVALRRAVVLGPPRLVLTPIASPVPIPGMAFDRQTLLLGRRGHSILQELRVGVIGAGGVGSVLIELLARLGVGLLLVIDPDRISNTNLPRMVGATRLDALGNWTTDSQGLLQRLASQLGRTKVSAARRQVRRAGFTVSFVGVCDDVLKPKVARQLLDCDYLFLAADSMQARLLVNAIVQQYLIPAYQLGAKVQVDRNSGEILEVFSVVRPILPGRGCLWCNGLIPAGRLQEEAATPIERQRQRYIDDPHVRAPSVITLNATAAARAANDFLFAVTGLAREGPWRESFYDYPRERSVQFEEPTADLECPECGDISRSRRARGDGLPLPVHQR